MLYATKRGFPVEKEIVLFKSRCFGNRIENSRSPIDSQAFQFGRRLWLSTTPADLVSSAFFSTFFVRASLGKTDCWQYLISAPPYFNLWDNLPTLTGPSLTLACHEASRSWKSASSHIMQVLVQSVLFWKHVLIIHLRKKLMPWQLIFLSWNHHVNITRTKFMQHLLKLLFAC